MLGDIREFAAGEHKQGGDENGFGNRAVFVRGGLEGLPGRVGEAVQVETIVPIGAPDERQAMGTETIERVAEAALQMLVERRFGAGRIVIGHTLIQDAPISSLFDIGVYSDNEPVGIIVKAAADIVIAAPGERLILVIRAARGQLLGGEVEDAFTGAARNHVHKAEQILVRIAEAEAAADARFIEGRCARHVEGRHALIGVPDVHHAIGVHVGRLHLATAEQFLPINTKLFECTVGIRCNTILGENGFSRLLVDDLRNGRSELLLLWVLLIAENKDDLAAFTGFEREPDVVRADRSPAVGDGIKTVSAFDGGRIVPASIGAQEDIALRVAAGDCFRASEEREVVAALAVFRLVVDHAVLDFDLADAEVALEVGGIVLRIPQAEFDRGEYGEFGSTGATIRNCQLPDFEILVEGYEVAGARFNAAVSRADRGVAHAVTAGILLQSVLCGLR